MEATPQTIPGFSAILFSYGEKLHRDLEVPVGLIVGAVGGTPSGSWLGKDAYDRSEACKKAVAGALETHDAEKAKKAYEAKLAAWEKQVAKAKAEGKKQRGRKPGLPKAPGESTRGEIGHLYERHIRSVVGYGIRGVLWDQGESGTRVLDSTIRRASSNVPVAIGIGVLLLIIIIGISDIGIYSLHIRDSNLSCLKGFILKFGPDLVNAFLYFFIKKLT